MNPNTFLKNAPRFLTTRYGSLNKYIQDTLASQETFDRIKLKFRTKQERTFEVTRIREVCQEASLVAFIFVIKKSFNEGSTAAKNAVDTFLELNVNGFRIGSKLFSGRNSNVLQGDMLAETLLASISNPRVRSLVQESKYLSDIIQEYQKIIDSNG